MLSAVLLFISLYVCLGVLCIISLYSALSLHNPPHLQVHFSLHVRWNKEDHALRTINLFLIIKTTILFIETKHNTTVTVT